MSPFTASPPSHNQCPPNSRAFVQLGGILRRGFLHGWRGGGAVANWGRWGQVAGGERSLKEGVRTEKHARGGRQMSGQLPRPRILRLPPRSRTGCKIASFSTTQACKCPVLSLYSANTCYHSKFSPFSRHEHLEDVAVVWNRVALWRRSTNRGCAHRKCSLSSSPPPRAASFQRVEYRSRSVFARIYFDINSGARAP